MMLLCDMVSGSSATVSELVPSLPASHAIFMHKLRVYDEPLGDVIALALTNGGDVVLLTDSDKKVHTATQLLTDRTDELHILVVFLKPSLSFQFPGESLQPQWANQVRVWHG